MVSNRFGIIRGSLANMCKYPDLFVMVVDDRTAVSCSRVMCCVHDGRRIWTWDIDHTTFHNTGSRVSTDVLIVLKPIYGTVQ